MDNLDEFQRQCLNEFTATSEYRNRLSKELSKGIKTHNVIISVDSYQEYLQAVCFSEIDSETLKSFSKNNGLRLISKSKIFSLELTNCGPMYKYIFQSSKRTYVPGTLIKDLGEDDFLMCERRLD